MKRQEHKQRFYLWDYIWWQGEMIRKLYYRPGRRINGSVILFLYIMALIIVPFIVPLISLCVRMGSTGITEFIILCIVIFVGTEWLDRIYRTRGKAVMKHYAKKKFNPVWGYLLSLFPFVILSILMLILSPSIK